MSEHEKDAGEAGHSSSTQMEHSSNSSHGGGSTLGKLLGWSVVAAAGYVIAKQWPEVQRYLKMRQM